MSFVRARQRHAKFDLAGIISVAIFLTAGPSLVFGQSTAETPRGAAPRIYVEAQGGFESYLSAAIVKKHVPAVVTQAKEQAQFVLTSAVESKEEGAGSKVARCLFMYCAGVEGSQTASVQLVNAVTQEVAWACNVHKPAAKAYQSTAEAVAKHLKQFLEEHPR